MGLVKHRPKIKLYLPPVAYPGRTVRATVELDAKHPVPIQYLDLRLDGSVRAFSQGSADANLALVQMGARLSEASLIPSGKSRFDCRLALPADLPPTHRGVGMHVAYAIRVDAGVEWWPDAKAEFVMNVGVPPTPFELPKVPMVYSSAPEGPKGTEPFAELSVGDARVESGGVIAGAVALGNVAHARYVAVDLALVAFERIRFWGDRKYEHARYAVRLRTDELREGAPIPFRIRLPQAPPSFLSPSVGLEWRLELCARRRFGRDLQFSVPFVVLPAAGEQRDEKERAAPPRVGAARLETVWAAVGAPLGYRLQGEELTQRVGDVLIVIRREQRDDGTYLVAEVGYPSLNIGLDGGAKQGIAAWFGNQGILVGITRLDREHQLKARDVTQARAFFDALLPALSELPPAMRFSRLHDEKIELALKNAGLTPAPLDEIARHAMVLARAIPVARAAIPAPADFDVESWQNLASALGGELAFGNMSIRGELGGHRVAVETEWAENQAYATAVHLTPRAAVDPKAFGVIRANDAVPPTLTGDAAAISRELAERFGELEIGNEGIKIALPALPSDATTALDVAHDLARIADLVAIDRSAYR